MYPQHVLVIVILFFPINHCCLDRGECGFSLSFKASVISEIHKRVPSGCIFVLYSPEYLANGGLGDWQRLVRTLRSLHGLLVVSGAAPLGEHASCSSGWTIAVPHRLSLADIHQVSGVKWIVFAKAETAADNPLGSVPSDSDMVVVQCAAGRSVDVWRFQGNWTRTLFGRWTNGKWRSPLSLSTAYSLKGMHITVAVISIPANSAEYNIKRPPGYEFWRVLAEVSNITYGLRVPVDGGFGRAVSGRWGGVVGLLQRGDADVAAEMLTFSAERARVMRYTLPLYADRQTLLVRREQALRAEWLVFAQPLSPRLWAALAATLLLSAVSLAAALAARGQRALSVASDAALYSACVFTVEGSPLCGSGRLVVRVWQVSATAAAVVVHAAFCAALVAIVAAPGRAPPFRGLQGLLDTPDYSLVVEANTSIHLYFQTSSSATVRGLYRRWLLPEHLASAAGRLQPSLERGLSAPCRQPRAAFMGMRSLHVRLAPRLPCPLAEVPGAATTVLYGFGVRRGFPYRGVLNYNLLRLRQTGVVSRLSLLASPPLPVEDAPPFQGVSLFRLVLPLVLLAAGLLVAAAVCLLEASTRRQPPAGGHIRSANHTHLPFLN